MGWSNGRELTSLSGNGINATFTYDASGLRLSKTVGSTTTVYEYVDGKLLYEKKGDMELHYGYDSEGQPRYIQYVKADGSTGSGYMVTNSRGDVVGIVNGNGVMIVNYEYDAWGNVLSVTDQNGAVITSAGHLGNLNSLRYRGYYYDTDLEMYYLQSRYYDPEVRRFINADDVSVLEEDQGSIVEHNMFAYCLNNPVNMLDESGTIAVTTCILIGAGIGAAIGGGVGAYRASKKYKPKDGWKYWKYVVEYGVIGGSVGALVGWGGKRPSC
ncbi:MAG: RHS repeat-associated core domain-containing protein [Lachnospiraceae bacterium]|nr:RHS repeat-associated core domain-containing protein [Lachnospiraceae bacterium]